MAERIEWSSPASLPGAQVMLVDDCARRWRWYHETYTVCTGLAIGEPAEWRYRRKAHLQTADGVMLIEPGEIHANTKITQPASFRVLGIPPELVRRAAEELGAPASWPHVRIAQIHGGAIHGAFRALHAALEGDSGPLEQQTLFCSALRLMLAHCTEAGVPALRRAAPQAVERARAYLHAHLAEAVTLDDLTRASGAGSRFHLVRTFSEAIGVPPHTYQLQLRISRGRELVAAGAPVVEAAARLGFADQSHFTRHFRRLLGVAPGAFARAVRPQSARMPASLKSLA